MGRLAHIAVMTAALSAFSDLTLQCCLSQEASSVGLLKQEIQFIGPWEGSFKKEFARGPLNEIKADLTAHAGRLTTIFRIKTTIEEDRINRYITCFYLMNTSMQPQAFLLSRSSVFDAASDIDCQKTVRINSLRSSGGYKLSYEMVGQKFEVTVATAAEWQKTSSGNFPVNVNVADFHFGMDYDEITEKLKDEGFEWETSVHSDAKSGALIKNLWAYKPYSLEEINQQCEYRKSSGIHSKQSIFFAFPGISKAAKPLSIEMNFHPPGTAGILAADVVRQLNGKYGSSSTRDERFPAWHFDQYGGTLQKGTVEIKGKGKPYGWFSYRNGALVGLFDDSGCRSAVRTLSSSLKTFVYSCQRDRKDFERHDNNFTPILYFPKDPGCAFTIETENTERNGNLDYLRVRATNRNAYVDFINAAEIDRIDRINLDDFERATASEANKLKL